MEGRENFSDRSLNPSKRAMSRRKRKNLGLDKHPLDRNSLVKKQLCEITS